MRYLALCVSLEILFQTNKIKVSYFYYYTAYINMMLILIARIWTQRLLLRSVKPVGNVIKIVKLLLLLICPRCSSVVWNESAYHIESCNIRHFSVVSIGRHFGSSTQQCRLTNRDINLRFCSAFCTEVGQLVLITIYA